MGKSDTLKYGELFTWGDVPEDVASAEPAGLSGRGILHLPSRAKEDTERRSRVKMRETGVHEATIKEPAFGWKVEAGSKGRGSSPTVPEGEPTMPAYSLILDFCASRVQEG